MSATQPDHWCSACNWPLVRYVGFGTGLKESPDVTVLPPLQCAHGMTRDEIQQYVLRDEWVCRWCRLRRYRVDRREQCPYCRRRWASEGQGRFASGEIYLTLQCECSCEARWYPERGWGETSDGWTSAERWQLLIGEGGERDPGKCGWCGAETFDFVQRPDGFFRRCTACKAIHRWWSR